MTPLIELSPQVVEEIVHRAGRPDFDRWSEQLQSCGHCSRPVRLRGRVLHQSASGRRSAYSTDDEPDRVLMIRCGNRRAAVCPSCSWEYAGDMWQLL
ncbi:MAG: replication initiator, partial [Pseudonocardiaceae bacterium]